jgi:SRSO17 transposase
MSWREGSNDPIASRFAAVRVRPNHPDDWRSTPRREEWLLIEWPAGKLEPTKYWLATLSATASRRALLDLAKLRWRVERDHQVIKQKLGLGHYEGRGWRGFHHHFTLCIAAYGFIIADWARTAPGEERQMPFLQTRALPEGYRARGTPNPL